MNVGDVVEVKASGRYERAELLDTTDPKRWLVRLERNGKRQGAYPHHVREIAKRGLPVPSERGPFLATIGGHTLHVETDPGLKADEFYFVSATGPARPPIVEQPKTHTPRNESHLDYVRGLACCHCRAPGPSEPHHFGAHGMGIKASDYEVAPLCGTDHDYWHDHGHLPGLDRVGSLAVMWEAAAKACAARLEGARRKR